MCVYVCICMCIVCMCVCVCVCVCVCEREHRRENRIGEAEAMLKCPESGCGFVAQSRAGLVNHMWQKHSASAMTTVPCQFCRRSFRPQHLRNHEKFCSSHLKP